MSMRLYLPVLSAHLPPINSVDKIQNQVELSLRKNAEVKAAAFDLNDLKKGQVVKGTIQRVETYGAFIRIEGAGVNGLCHKSKVTDDEGTAWTEFVKQGKEVKAVVLDVNVETRKISLGLKKSLFPVGEDDEGEESEEEEEGSEDDVMEGDDDDDDDDEDIDIADLEFDDGESDEDAEMEAEVSSWPSDWPRPLLTVFLSDRRLSHRPASFPPFPNPSRLLLSLFRAASIGGETTRKRHPPSPELDPIRRTMTRRRRSLPAHQLRPARGPKPTFRRLTTEQATSSRQPRNPSPISSAFSSDRPTRPTSGSSTSPSTLAFRSSTSLARPVDEPWQRSTLGRSKRS